MSNTRSPLAAYRRALAQGDGFTEREASEPASIDELLAVSASLIPTPDDDSAVGCAHVRLAPGARTAWHTHPRGQTLYVTDGIGLVATRDDGVREIRPGDVVHVAPGEEHWHGATPDRFMAHVAIQQADDAGEVVTWLQHVTDEEYADTGA